MRVALIFSVVLFAIGVASCGVRDDTDPSDRQMRDVLDPSEVTRPTMPATRTVRALPPQPRAPEPPRTAGRLNRLAKTTWRAGDFVFVFEPGGHLIVRGGHFDQISEAGVPGRVVNRDGVLTFDIVGRTTYGTWDGAALTIENVTAVRVDHELARGETLIQ